MSNQEIVLGFQQQNNPNNPNNLTNPNNSNNIPIIPNIFQSSIVSKLRNKHIINIHGPILDEISNPIVTPTVIQLENSIVLSKKTDIYLCSFITYGANQNNTADNMMFNIGIKQFEINSESTSPWLNNRLLIVNKTTGTTSESYTHVDSEKIYVSSINPKTISAIEFDFKNLSLSQTHIFKDVSEGPHFNMQFLLVERD